MVAVISSSSAVSRMSINLKVFICSTRANFLLTWSTSFHISSTIFLLLQSDEKSEAVRKLAQGYQDGNFEIAREYFTPDGKHYFKNIEYTTDEIIDGYNFHSVLYDNLKHVNPMITTMYYNNGEVYTNHWLDWSGT